MAGAHRDTPRTAALYNMGCTVHGVGALGTDIFETALRCDDIMYIHSHRTRWLGDVCTAFDGS